MTSTTTTPALTALDRCDGCGARAAVEYSNGLLFCQHHSNEHASALASKGITPIGA